MRRPLNGTDDERRGDRFCEFRGRPGCRVVLGRAMNAGISTTEAAKHLGVKPSTVQRWIRKGCPVQSLGAVGRNKGSLVNLDEVNRWRSRRCGATSVQRDNESILAMIETALVDTLKRDQAHERVEIHRGLASGLLALAYQRIWQNLTRRSLDEFVLPPEIAQLCVIWLDYIETRHTTYRR